MMQHMEAKMPVIVGRQAGAGVSPTGVGGFDRYEPIEIYSDMHTGSVVYQVYRPQSGRCTVQVSAKQDHLQFIEFAAFEQCHV
jgi:hypothetical protein